MKRPAPTRILTIFAWLGIMLVIIIVVAARYTRLVKTFPQNPSGQQTGIAADQFIPPNEPLGELGSHCGGRLRLPCRPGLQCSVDERQTEELGTCVQPTQPAANAPPQLNEVCAPADPCVAGLYCKAGTDRATCQLIDVAAPKVDSLELDGMQFDNGMYRAKTGQLITVNATTTNAVDARMRLVQDGTFQDLGILQNISDGSYRGTFTVSPGLSGVLEIIIVDQKGNSAMLSANVATLP